jgi:hypothetical protein
MPRLLESSEPLGLPLDIASRFDALRSTYKDVVSEMSSLAISPKAARANQGNTSRLRWQLSRCLVPPAKTAKSAVIQRPELRVLVLGCSMTQGFMNCGTTIAGYQCNIPCDSLAWSRQLERRLQSGLPGCRIKMSRTTSRGGRTVTTAQRYETRVRRSAAHVIVTDLTVCDLRGIASSLDELRVRAGWETLLRRVLSEEQVPALVHIESWAAFSPMGPCRNRSAHTLHLPLAERYGVPVTSFMLGTCAHRPEIAPRRHWRGGCSGNASTCGGVHGVRGLDAPGFDCEPHPGPHTHKVFALLLTELILGEAKRMLHLRGGRGGAGAGGWSFASVASNGWQAAAPPTAAVLKPAPLDLTSMPTMMPASALGELSGCHAHHGVGNPLATLDFAEGGCGSPTHSAGWRCYEDRPGKRGWISEDGPLVSTPPNTAIVGPSGSAPSLAFSVPLGSAKLTVAYLRSYDARMGAARVWVDDDVSAAIVLNGSWASRTSQTDIYTERMATLCRESCQVLRRGGSRSAPPKHTVHVQRVSGRKFKLLLLEVC